MTREEAIKILRNEIECLSHDRCSDCPLDKVCDQLKISSDLEYMEAFGIAIKALSAIEDIKAEIVATMDKCYSRYYGNAYTIRYGMELCLEIIDKHIGEKESE